MSFFRRLFGGKVDKEPAPVAEIDHQGYHISTTPVPENGQYRLAATISREVNGEHRQHRLVRADLFPSADQASEAAIRKAKIVIEEQGDKLFG
jgi:hypothetical protein